MEKQTINFCFIVIKQNNIIQRDVHSWALADIFNYLYNDNPIKWICLKLGYFNRPGQKRSIISIILLAWKQSFHLNRKTENAKRAQLKSTNGSLWSALQRKAMLKGRPSARPCKLSLNYRCPTANSPVFVNFSPPLLSPLPPLRALPTPKEKSWLDRDSACWFAHWLLCDDRGCKNEKPSKAYSIWWVKRWGIVSVFKKDTRNLTLTFCSFWIWPS